MRNNEVDQWAIDRGIRKVFNAYWIFAGWDSFQIGFHIHFSWPKNIEIHLPFGLFRVGWEYERKYDANYNDMPWYGLIR